jgi:hypothetical protein
MRVDMGMRVDQNQVVELLKYSALKILRHGEAVPVGVRDSFGEKQ